MNIENENISGAEKSAEQLASENNLDLAIQDDAAEQGGASDQSAQNEAGVNSQNTLSGLLSVVPMVLDVMKLKNAAAVWSEPVIAGVSARLVPVLDKYAFGRRFLGYLESGGGVEEFALLMALSPVVVGTYRGYMLDIEVKEKTVQGEEVKAESQKNGVHSADTPLGSTFEFKG